MSSASDLQKTRQRPYINCDVHPWVSDIKHLYPYMSESWVKRFQYQQLNVGGLKLSSRFVHPSGSTARPDARPPSGEYPGSDPDFVKQQYLSTYQPEMAILLPQQANSLAAWTDPERVMALAAAFNDYFISEWLPKDSSFRYAVVAPPQDPELAAKEIRRIGSHEGVCAVMLPLIDILMGHRYYYPIYEAAVEMNLPVITHPHGQEGSSLGAPALAGGIQTSYNERFVNLSQIAQSNISSLIFEGVFEKYPSLNVAFVEYGFSWLLPLQWKMDTVWKALRIDTPWVKRLPSEYIYDHIRFTTQPLEEPEPINNFYQWLDMMQGDRLLMYSSDYPHWDNDMPNRVLNKLSTENKDRIFRKNALDFYRF